MNKDLEKIQKTSAVIMGDYPQQRVTLLHQIQLAQDELAKARSEQEQAEDMDSYSKAVEAAKQAERWVNFAQNALKKLDAAPRMDEADYMKALNTCRNIMESAAAEYREKAVALMDQLRALQEGYLQTAKDTNDTLIKLDEAANILQSKYPCREIERQGASSAFVPDSNAWKRYALRYDNGTPCRLATQSTPEERDRPHMVHDSVLVSAWQAVSKGFPHKVF